MFKLKEAVEQIIAKKRESRRLITHFGVKIIAFFGPKATKLYSLNEENFQGHPKKTQSTPGIHFQPLGES